MLNHIILIGPSAPYLKEMSFLMIPKLGKPIIWEKIRNILLKD